MLPSTATWRLRYRLHANNIDVLEGPVQRTGAIENQTETLSMRLTMKPHNTTKEIGWFPIHAVDSTDSSVFSFSSAETVFHWHGETFDLPPGAIRLAKSEGCENQAFQLGKSVIGLQFHLETTPESAEQIVSHCRDELVPAKYVQSEEEILSVSQNRYNSINHLMGSILAFLQRNSG